MRKFLFVVMALLLLITALPVAAVAPMDLAALAQYYPADAPAFAAFRTDDGFIQELDALAEMVSPNLPEGLLPPGMNATIALDSLAQQIDQDATFESMIGNWVGDSLAIGFTSTEAITRGYGSDEYLVTAVAITDATAAQAFLAESLYQPVVEEVDGGVLIYEEDPSYYSTVYYITDDVMLTSTVGEDPASIIPSGDSLADSAAFQDAMGRLPASDYNLVFYVDPTSYTESEDFQYMMEDMQYSPMQVDLASIINGLGPQSGGATIIDGRSLALDFVLNYADAEALANAGVDMPDGYAPISLDFANLVGADVPLYIQATDAGSHILESVNMLTELGNYFEDDEILDQFYYDGANELQFADDAATFMRQTYSGLSGLSLEEAFGWMTGNYAAYLDFTPAGFIPVIPQAGVLVENTDAGAASAFVAGNGRMLYEMGFDVLRDDTSVTLTTLGDAAENDQLDVLLAVNDSAVVAGTRGAVEPVLAGEGGFTETAAFTNAQSAFLPDTITLAFINFDALTPTLEILAEYERDIRDMLMLMPVLESASITATYNDNGGVVRMVLTLHGE